MRWLLRIGGILMLALVAMFVAVLMLPNERIVRIATDQIEARTGRTLTVSGDVSLSFWPTLGVRTGPVTLGNADWAGPEPMLSARAMSIGISAADLLTGTVRITGLSADEPILRLQKNGAGQANWDFETVNTSDAPGTNAPVSETGGSNTAAEKPIALERLTLRNGRIIYQEVGTDPVTISELGLDLTWPEPDGPASISASLRPADTLLHIEAEVSNPTQFIAEGVARLRARAELPATTIEFDGRANTAAEFSGHLDLTSSDIDKGLAAFGLPVADFPAGWGPDLKVSADVTYTAESILNLRALQSEIGENRMNGVADIELGDVPRVTAKLSAGVLNFPSGTSGQPKSDTSSEPAPGVSGDGWSKSPIDASALSLVNGSVRVSADGITTPDLRVGEVQLVLEIDRSRAVLKIEEASVFNGQIAGQLVANNRNGLSVGGNLAATNIDILQAQRDLLGFERVRGSADGQLKFLGVGETTADIMQYLSGEGSLKMGTGVILGFDLDRLTRGDTSTGGTTVFDSLSANFAISNGNAQNNDLLLQLKNYRAEGQGRIGLGARDIDYTFTPIALRARSGQGISLPIRIRGPWGAPRIWPDLEAAAKANADAELEELENKAKAKLQQKLAEELDVQIEQGQDAKEILKDSLEDKAKNQLLKLLGRD